MFAPQIDIFAQTHPKTLKATHSHIDNHISNRMPMTKFCDASLQKPPSETEHTCHLMQHIIAWICVAVGNVGGQVPSCGTDRADT